MNIFDISKNISNGKQEIPDSPEFHKVYSQFMINRIMSCSPDLIFLANEANKIKNISNQIHYAYWFNVVHKKNRYFKYPKVEKEDKETLDIIGNYYNVPEDKARELLCLLSKENIDNIKKTYISGKF